MRFTSVTIFCPVCGSPRDVTRRVRSKTCADCLRELARKDRQTIQARRIADWLQERQQPVIYKLVLRVLEAQHLMKRAEATDKQRARAGK